MKTPIEKAAEEVFQRITRTGKYLNAPVLRDPESECAAIIQKILDAAAPERKRTYGRGMGSTLDSLEADAYNQCRRDIGLEDSNDR